jgi:hypothetical protein
MGQIRMPLISHLINAAGSDAGQRIHPKWCQITSPNVPPPQAESPPGIAAVESPDQQGLLTALVAVATGLWRVRKRLLESEGVELPPQLRLFPRHLEAAWGELAAAGIEVKDHTNERYVLGMAVNPVAFESSAEVTTERIIETLKPTVTYRSRLIQRADVIVARPSGGDMGSAAIEGVAGTGVAAPASPQPQASSSGGVGAGQGNP